MSGFQFTETMAGTYTRDGEARPIRFTVEAHAANLLQHLADHKATLEGILDAEGLASHAPLTGEIVINPIFGRVIRYEFGFTGNDGKPYRFAGQKDVTIFDPIGSMTTLRGEITDEGGDRFASATLRFDTRDLTSFLGSFRPTR